MHQLLLQEFFTFLKHKGWSSREKFTRDEIYKAFNAGATASIGALAQVANKIQNDCTQVTNSEKKLQ